MNDLMLRAGQGLGLLGLALMAAAVLLRFTGRFVIGSFESGTLLLGGIGATAAGCFALLWVIVARQRA